MSLILGLGTNIGDKKKNIDNAIDKLSHHFGEPISISRTYCSEAFGHIKQDDFYNLCIEYKLPSIEPIEVLSICNRIEHELGRVREVKWGPRIIDIDILYYSTQTFRSKELTIPHPLINERSFVVLPLQELDYFETLKRNFSYPEHFSTKSIVIND